jgi:hypothetical protein
MTTKACLAKTPSVPIWMGELSGGKSATSPTFFRSTSVRTRTDLQNEHTVWTLLDQRKLMFAPQFGQTPEGPLTADHPLPQRYQPNCDVR